MECPLVSITQLISDSELSFLSVGGKLKPQPFSGNAPTVALWTVTSRCKGCGGGGYLPLISQPHGLGLAALCPVHLSVALYCF